MQVAQMTDLQKVIDFRLEWMRAAGYKPVNALRIAEDTTVDWHTAYDLRKKCEDEKLCMRVLFGK